MANMGFKNNCHRPIAAALTIIALVSTGGFALKQRIGRFPTRQ
jgi:hypothetical protein